MTAEVGKSEAIKMNSKKELFDLLKKADREIFRKKLQNR